MSSSIGKRIHVTVFGQSHGKGIGVVVDGLPPGEPIDISGVNRMLQRRAPGKSPLVTQRKEQDAPVWLSGIENGVTCGAPLCAVIENQDMQSKDYEQLKNTPRPAHADYTADIRFKGFQDARGGGHFSGRLTAPLCIAGAVCKQMLERRGVTIGAHLYSVGSVLDESFHPEKVTSEDLLAVIQKDFPVISEEAGEKMKSLINEASSRLDSVGGVIECCALNFPAGIGTPMFDGIENRLSAAIFGIPAIKGIEFGAGFASAAMSGSQNNDAFCVENGAVRTRTNNHGGILGGISSGMPIIFRVAVKPTPSIGLRQESVNLGSMQPEALTVQGRHDPCIALRAVPCVESVAAIVLLDMLLCETI
ncbi:MAG: chorismate synthase [Christensenellales bacterium]